MLLLRLGTMVLHHTGAGKPGIPDISPKPDFAFHSNKAFPLSHDQTFISTPLTRSIGQMFVISFICGAAGLYFYICVFHRLLHFLCTEDLSIRQAPHYHPACNLPEQCLRKGGREGALRLPQVLIKPRKMHSSSFAVHWRRHAELG